MEAMTQEDMAADYSLWCKTLGLITWDARFEPIIQGDNAHVCSTVMAMEERIAAFGAREAALAF